MDEEDLVERILHDIKCNFSKEPNMDEFDIIPIFESRNKCPVVVVGTKMALEAWCVNLVWLHVYKSLMDWRENGVKVDDDKLADWSQIILLINPDVTSVWNVRKELFVSEQISVEDEFRLCRLILTRKPKSSDVFIHRRWLLKQILQKEEVLDLKYREKLINDELLLTTLSASKHPNNYSAWSHREWVHENVTVDKFGMLLEDLKWNESFVQLHVSDYSGFHFREFLLRNICAELKSNCCDSNMDGLCNHLNVNLKNILEKEWTFLTELTQLYRRYEALWYHRRSVIHLLHSFHAVQHDEQSEEHDHHHHICKKTRTHLNNDPATDSLSLTSQYIVNLNDEIEFVSKLSDKESEKLINNHKRWLAHTFHLQFQ